MSRTVPESSLLAKVKAFLPEIERANQSLLEKIQTEGDDDIRIDLVKEKAETNDTSDSDEEEDNGDVQHKAPVIQMDLAVGCFEPDHPLFLAEEEMEQKCPSEAAHQEADIQEQKPDGSIEKTQTDLIGQPFIIK
mmetsp:Transcript_66/g.71  ORF Transcript_66/g.71 Transcript_66/m.71 type:complete len:135 (+) Transcript_66:129-533(+)|eukprot:CAMPEP_0117751944 /NCGR_PEP_ID=MMETSP0947-20121206/11290_1 /TAXON_ID=44440 /ORGANISM="Chattonella subsalsa, Strain CCMP2191" /LENGTH=134 /DNA_ID=CAMNT_0005570449 /DNA_START=171 /DNA_END=575 /DNA_ORIENTATION=+